MIARAAGAAIAGLMSLAQPAQAAAPESSLRPVARGVAAATPEAMAVIAATRPRARPASPQEISAAAQPASLAFAAPGVSPFPLARPDSVVQQAMAKRRARRQGGICGSIDIQGDVVGFVPGKLNGCGIDAAVRVRSVSGVVLSRPSLMNCPTAQALNAWVEKGLKPAFRRRGPVGEMTVIADYACRTRNNRPGARISEHGKGKAIDISGFTMQDGELVTVGGGWGRGSTRKPLRKAFRSACGPFGTTLGPDADRFHRNHFHLDTASYRGGPYCK